METRTGSDYGRETVEVALSALVELFTILGSYREALVLLGGWAPYFLLLKHQSPRNAFKHAGSIDTDIAIDPDLLDDKAYATIVELITKRGYAPKTDSLGNPVPSSFIKAFEKGGTTYEIQVDFMTSRGTAGKKRRGSQVQRDLRARMSDGCEIVFSHNFRHKVAAQLPENGEVTAEIRVADLVGILATKGLALGDRYKEKDAYDIYASIANYEDGPSSAATVIRPFTKDPVVKKGLDRTSAAFASRESNGPAWVATFMGALSGAERERIVTDAYRNVNEFLARVSG